LHKKASALLRFEIFNTVEIFKKQINEIEVPYKRARGKAFGFEKVMVKARLPNTEELAWYDDLYPFIACKTSCFSSTELYIIKYKDVSAMKQAYIKVKKSFEYESTSIQHYCAYISSRSSYTTYVKIMYAISNSIMFLVNQSGVVDFTKELVTPYARDWTISSMELPNCYVSKKNRTMGTVSLNAISDFSDYIEEGQGDSIRHAYEDIKEEYEAGVQNGGTALDDPSFHLDDNDNEEFAMDITKLKTARAGTRTFRTAKIVKKDVEEEGKEEKQDGGKLNVDGTGESKDSNG